MTNIQQGMSNHQVTRPPHPTHHFTIHDSLLTIDYSMWPRASVAIAQAHHPTVEIPVRICFHSQVG